MSQNVAVQWPQPLEGEKRPLSRLSVTSLVCGVLSVFGFIPFGVVGFVFGLISRRQLLHDQGFRGRGLATLGVILSVIGVTVWLSLIIYLTVENNAELTRLLEIKSTDENGDIIVMEHPLLNDSF